MMKQVLKRFLSLTLVLLMTVMLLPSDILLTTAYAATSGTVTGLADENIGLSFTGDADDAWSANGTSIIGAATSTGGTCGDTPYSSTLTITNKKSTTATLSFDYSIEQNNGKIQVDGTEVSSGASFTKELAAKESVKVYIKSGSTSAATKITLTNVVLVSDVNATATFVPAENGTYTVDGKLITEEYSNTQSSMTAYQVVATPADGYQFLGWYNLTTGKCIATAATTALNIESDCTVTAKFASKTAALFETGGQRFDDLNKAVAYAQANSQSKITLASDGSISGNYTIPAGITLLIPFDAAGTLYTDAPAAIRTTPASKAFRTLTMSEGTSITVNGAISLGGRYFAAGGGQQGRSVGDYGYIKMADNSSITVKNGGKLYAWGFISGSGSVLAESGATVYEFYQIADFRGGSASSGMSHGVFPFSQYFVQNIEVPLTLNAGANEIVYSGVYAMSTTYTTSINFIGDNGMFKVESGSFTKDYDEKTDRLVFTVNGEAALNTLSLTLAGHPVDSASYVLPITNNITINIQSGNVTINQDAALLAGVQVNIAEGAGLTVANGKNIYFYDSDEWKSDNFVWGPCKFKSVAYAPGKVYNRSDNDLVDATRGLACTVVLMPEGEDIDSLLRTQGVEAFEALQAQAPDGLRFCLDVLRALAPRETVEWAKNFLRHVEVPELVSPYVSRLATHLQLSEAELRQGLADSRRPGPDGQAARPGRARQNMRDRQIMMYAVRYPDRLDALRDLGADLALQSDIARQLWDKLEEWGPDEAPYHLDQREKNFWSFCRGAEAAPRDGGDRELAALRHDLDAYYAATQRQSVTAALRQNTGTGDFAADLEYLRALQETLEQGHEQS